MTLVDATLGLEAGIALALSLSRGSTSSRSARSASVPRSPSAALLGATTGARPSASATDGAEAAACSVSRPPRESGLVWLAAFGGPRDRGARRA